MSELRFKTHEEVIAAAKAECAAIGVPPPSVPTLWFWWARDLLDVECCGSCNDFVDSAQMMHSVGEDGDYDTCERCYAELRKEQTDGSGGAVAKTASTDTGASPAQPEGEDH